jgi:hypothetical protein
MAKRECVDILLATDYIDLDNFCSCLSECIDDFDLNDNGESLLHILRDAKIDFSHLQHLDNTESKELMASYLKDLYKTHVSFLEQHWPKRYFSFKTFLGMMALATLYYIEPMFYNTHNRVPVMSSASEINVSEIHASRNVEVSHPASFVAATTTSQPQLKPEPEPLAVSYHVQTRSKSQIKTKRETPFQTCSKIYEDEKTKSMTLKYAPANFYQLEPILFRPVWLSIGTQARKETSYRDPQKGHVVYPLEWPTKFFDLAFITLELIPTDFKRLWTQQNVVKNKQDLLHFASQIWKGDICQMCHGEHFEPSPLYVYLTSEYHDKYAKKSWSDSFFDWVISVDFRKELMREYGWSVEMRKHNDRVNVGHSTDDAEYYRMLFILNVYDVLFGLGYESNEIGDIWSEAVDEYRNQNELSVPEFEPLLCEMFHF